MHAAIADGGDRAAGAARRRRPAEVEVVAFVRRLLHQQHAQAAVAQRAIGIGARHHHQHARPCRRRCTRSWRRRAASRPARASPCSVRLGDVGAVVGLGDRDRAQRVAGGQARQPMRLLLARAAREQRARQDFRPRDQAAGGGERAFATAPPSPAPSSACPRGRRARCRRSARESTGRTRPSRAAAAAATRAP